MSTTFEKECGMGEWDRATGHEVRVTMYNFNIVHQYIEH